MKRVAPLLLAGLPAQAEITGTWCGAQALLHIDAQGIGWGEHTICQGATAPFPPALAATLTCENVYPDGGSVTRIPLDAPIRLTAVHLDDDAAGEIYARCD